MKVLVLGPDHPQGSLPPYLDVLTAQLRRHGADTLRLGSSGPPYDPRHGWATAEEIIQAADALARRLDPREADIISVHAGNLELEQLLLWRWREHGHHLPPVVIHVHALRPTLFTDHRPDPHLLGVVDDTITRADGLLFFGAYARTQLTARLPTTATTPHRIAPLPTTIPPGTVAHAPPALAHALAHTPQRDPAREHPHTPTLTLAGYAAPWKSPALLIEALTRTTAPLRVILVGPFWDDPTQTGTDLRPAVHRPLHLGRAAHLSVVPTYADAAARAALVDTSDAGLFPYQLTDSGTFQGSGALADYLARSRPVIATDVANMAELTGPAAAIVPPADPAALAAALDRFATTPAWRQQLTTAAAECAPRFTPAAHTTACLDLYEHLHTRTRSTR